jgi:methionyl aminopeptidase
MTLQQAPKIPVRKSDLDINFYRSEGPKFGLILKRLHDIIKKDIPCDIEAAFETACATVFGSEVSYPFCQQKNYLNEPFGHSICISVNEVIAHGRPRLFHEGDIVSVDCGISLPYNNRRLNFDAAFTVVCGGDEEWIYGPHKALQNLLALNPKTTHEIAEIIQNTAKSLSLQQVVALTGHGIGYMLHEEPKIHNAVGPFRSVKLFENLVFCAEPIFVNPGNDKNSSAISSTCIGSDGWEITTTSGRNSSHFETMFGIINGRITDLIGVSEWSL